MQKDGYGLNFRLGETLMASGGKYLETVKNQTDASQDKADQLQTQIKVKKAGTYYVYARLSCPSFDDDSYFVSIDNGSWTVVNGLSTGGSWEWKELFKGQLTKGTHQLRIGGREGGACIDKLCVTTSSTPPITIGGSKK